MVYKVIRHGICSIDLLIIYWNNDMIGDKSCYS
jgi:hypothetical protein